VLENRFERGEKGTGLELVSTGKSWDQPGKDDRKEAPTKTNIETKDTTEHPGKVLTALTHPISAVDAKRKGSKAGEKIVHVMTKAKAWKGSSG